MKKYNENNLLNETLKIYNFDEIIKQESNGKYQSHMFHELALIEKANGGYIFADYEAICTIQDQDGKYKIEIEETEGTTPNEKGEFIIHVFGCGWFSFTLREIWEKYTPSKTIKASDFFTKRNYNERCIYNFSNMIKILNGDK